MWEIKDDRLTRVCTIWIISLTLRQQQRGFEMKLESGEATIQTLVQTQTRPSSILNAHHHSPLSLYYRYSNSNQQCIVQCCLTNQINQKLSFSNNFSDWVIFCQFCTLHWFLLMQICFLLQGTMNEKYETVHDKYITHIKDKYCQLKSSWDLVRKLWKREEVMYQSYLRHISVISPSYISHMYISRISVIHQSYISHTSVIHQSCISHISVIYQWYSYISVIYQTSFPALNIFTILSLSQHNLNSDPQYMLYAIPLKINAKNIKFDAEKYRWNCWEIWLRSKALSFTRQLSSVDPTPLSEQDVDKFCCSCGREKKWRSKMMTITVTRHVGPVRAPEFKVYLPDGVSDCLFVCSLSYSSRFATSWDL